jgi:class IV lanthipeptide synthase
MGEATSSFRDLLSRAVTAAGNGWRLDPPGSVAKADPWIWVRRNNSVIPDAGWKLHVSATPWSAPEVLRRALHVLLAEDARFKVAASTNVVLELNEGGGGLDQIGKFMTVYPTDDAQAVRLAVELDRATEGLRGPLVASDRPLRPGSLVHYRHGPFLPPGRPEASGRSRGAHETARRRDSFPADAVDPFRAKGLGVDRPSGPIAGRFVPLRLLSRSPRGSVHLGIDARAGSPCVLKRAARDARATPDGRDARDHLRHERDVLWGLHPRHPVPAVLDLVELDQDLILVLEYIEGATLSAHVLPMAPGGMPTTEDVVARGREIAAVLRALHESGFVWRDLNAGNVIVTATGIRLVDFELAHRIHETVVVFGGSLGYSSPQQLAGEPGAVTDDVYSLGALLYFLATGVDPAFCDRPFDLLRVRIAEINRALHPGVERVVARCLDRRPARRYHSMEALDRDLVEIPGD